MVGRRKPTVDCDAEISYCRQWVDAGVQQLNVSCSDLVQLLLGPEPYQLRLLWGIYTVADYTGSPINRGVSDNTAKDCNTD